MEPDNIQPIQQGNKPVRTRASFQKQIEGRLVEARLKEAESKVKAQIEKIQAAQKIVAALEEELLGIYESFADVLPE